MADAGPIDPYALQAPPCNTGAEQALLGAILADNGAYLAVADLVAADDFVDDAHARIFAALAQMIVAGHVANPITLRTAFERDEGLADVGGAEYLGELAGSVIRGTDAPDYARLIADLANLRRILDRTHEADLEARAGGIDCIAEDLRRRLIQDLEALRCRGGVEETVSAAQGIDAAFAATEAAAANEGLVGLSTGFSGLDDLIHGLVPGQLTILAARPSMGKSSMAGAIAVSNARAHQPVGLVSLEMMRAQQWQRILSAETGLSLDDITKGQLEGPDWDRLVEAKATLQGLPLWMTDRRGLTMDRITAMARAWKRERGLSLLIVDHMHKIAPEPGRRWWGKTDDLTAISDGLARLAGDLDVPVLALAQLSRAVESRDDKRPMLSDLRESGSIEQDADVVIFLYREEYYLQRGRPQRNEKETAEKYSTRLMQWQDHLERVAGAAEAIVGKSRHGRVGSVRLGFHAAQARFSNLAAGDAEQERMAL